MFENKVDGLTNEQLLSLINCKTIHGAEAILAKNGKAQIKSPKTISQVARQCKLGQKKSESALFAISAANVPVDILAYILTTSLAFPEILLLSIAGLLLCGVAIFGAFVYNHLRIDQKREAIIDNLLLNYLKLAACQAFKNNTHNQFPNLKNVSFTKPAKNTEESLLLRDRLLSKATRPAVQALGLGVTAGAALFLSYFFSSTVILASLGVGTVALAATGGPLFFGIMACCFLFAGLLAYRYYQALKPWKAIKDEIKILETSVSDSRVECASLHIAAEYEKAKEKQMLKKLEAQTISSLPTQERLPKVSTNPHSFYVGSLPSENQSEQVSLYSASNSGEDETPLLREHRERRRSL